MTTPAPSDRAIDGVSLAVLANRLESVVRKMSNTLFRTARSGVINSARDFSCCILTGDDELLSVAESLPIHVLSGPDLIAGWMRTFHPELKRGDAFLHNSPYHGNSHPGDHCLVAPVIDDDGVHRFTVLVKAHVADCGNSLPTTLMPTARDVYEEGALIFPCVKIQNGYENVDDVIRMCMMRIRVPEMWWGDYLGMLGAIRIGERELTRVADEIGWDELTAHARSWLDYSEDRMVSAIRKLPSGSSTASSRHDPLPGVEDGIRVETTVEIKNEQALIEVDFTRSDDCPPAGVNLTEATSRTAGMVAVFNSVDPSVPKNAGSFRRIHVKLRENCVVGIPPHPASCSTATTGVADRATNAAQRALANIVDGAGMAETGSFGPASCAVISGNDQRRGGAPFVNMIFFITGGAGSPHNDGWLTICHVGNGGMMLRDSVEVVEQQYPFRVLVDELVPDSEGAGRFRGAPANLVEYGPVDDSMSASWSADTTVFPPQGVLGGLSGSPAQAFVREASGSLRQIKGCWGHVTIGPDETIVSYSPTGGGYGSPLERDAERVSRDVHEGLVSAERAASVYGVVIDDDGSVDIDETAALRARLA